MNVGALVAGNPAGCGTEEQPANCRHNATSKMAKLIAFIASLPYGDPPGA